MSRDDRHVIYLSGRGGSQAPWMGPIEGGEPTEIVKAFAQAGSVDVSPDGGRLAFVSSEAQNQFVVMVCDPPSCTNRQRLPLPTTNFSPARDRCAGHPTVGRSPMDINGSNIWSQPLDGGPPRQITHFSDRQVASFAWSRDGKRLAVARDNDQRHRAVEGIEEVGEGPAEAGHYEPLEKLDSSCSNPALGPVGARVAHDARELGAWTNSPPPSAMPTCDGPLLTGSKNTRSPGCLRRRRIFLPTSSY